MGNQVDGLKAAAAFWRAAGRLACFAPRRFALRHHRRCCCYRTSTKKQPLGCAATKESWNVVEFAAGQFSNLALPSPGPTHQFRLVGAPRPITSCSAYSSPDAAAASSWRPVDASCSMNRIALFPSAGGATAAMGSTLRRAAPSAPTGAALRITPSTMETFMLWMTEARSRRRPGLSRSVMVSWGLGWFGVGWWGWG